MMEEMDGKTLAEVAKEETEQKMVYKILCMIKEAQNKNEKLSDLEVKVRALLSE